MNKRFPKFSGINFIFKVFYSWEKLPKAMINDYNSLKKIMVK